MNRSLRARGRTPAPHLTALTALARPARVGAILLLLAPGPAVGLSPTVIFESGQVRPLAISPDGSRLFAVNTPDGRLEIFALDGGGLTHVESVPVGMEPVAVAARSDGEVWVVNHLSDSVSVVDVSASPARVVRTLFVGDEPNDIVFAGPGRSRAFISAAHRGQNSPHPRGDYDQEGVGRADVWVFDATDPGSGPGGTPLAVLTVFGDKPRALETNADGSRVYVAVFHSGNRTTALTEALVCNGGVGASSCSGDGITMPGGLPGGLMPGGLPAPNSNHEGTPGPETGLIVRFDPAAGDFGEWRDELGRNWNNAVRFSLPDKDVFEIDASATPPVVVKDGGSNPEDDRACIGVGTVLFNLLRKPGSELLYVSNTEARNEVRFEGPATSFSKPSGAPDTVRGHLHEARITVLDPTQPTCSVLPRHLNKHIDYSISPVPAGVKERSLATPLGMAASSDGSTLYVAAFGSGVVGVFDTTELEADTFVPDAADHIALPGGGPTGLVLDESRGRLYVLTRFDNTVVAIDTGSRTVVDAEPLFDTEPPHVRSGRRFLYDARKTSSNGEASCAACHVFADMDDLAWDLGDPDGNVVPQNLNPNGPIGGDNPVHPMKGPMTTQTLRGLARHGPMHWRGDRTGATFEGDPKGLDEELAFKAFNVAFGGLLGRDEGPLTAAEMQSFTDFILEVTLPPNPIARLDGSLRSDEAAGRSLYFGPITDTIATCHGCHTLDPAQGFFGTSGLTTLEGEPQEFKVPHLRNAYQKVGMFGMPAAGAVAGGLPPGNNGDQGPQIRGFGFLHDGSIDTLFRFLSATLFSLSDADQRNLEAFVMAFPSTLAPVVGQQVTLSSTNADTVAPRIDLLIQRASTPFPLVGEPGARECDLVVKGTVAGEARGWLYDPTSGTFLPDAASDPPRSDAELRALSAVPGQELTFTCAPPGSGARMGIDRDLDGILDRDEAGGPGAGACPPVPEPPGTCRTPGRAILLLKDRDQDGPGPGDRFVFKWLRGAATQASEFGDPVGSGGQRLCLYTGASPSLATELAVPAGGTCSGDPCWKTNGSRGYRYRDLPAASADGIHKVVLTGGGSGKSRVIFLGRDGNLPATLPATPVDTTGEVIVQVRSDATGICFEERFAASEVIRNEKGVFRAKR